MRRSVAVAAILLGLAAVWGVVRYAHRPARIAPGAATGEHVTLRFFKNPTPVPAFTARTLDGRQVSAADYRGKVTIINFWATWCPPCRAEIPDLVELQKKYGDHLQIVGVSEDEGPREVVDRFVADHKMNYPVVMATPELERMFPGITALPTSFIVDREGRIVQKHVGMLTASLTEQETRALAGLPVNATIEQVDRDKPVPLANAAEVTKIPGVDLSHFTPERRRAAVEKLNAETCTCGCNLTVAKCRTDDPACDVSLPLARQLVDQIANQP